MNRPKMFIGSSSEGLEIAKALQVLLDAHFEITVWNQGVFGLSQTAFESLVDGLRRFDFACLVLTPDDLVESRGKNSAAPRDNVLFELGLFYGGLGRARTFLVFERNQNLKLPSDLTGVTAATFERHTSGNLLTSLGACSTQIENHARSIGAMERGIDKTEQDATSPPVRPHPDAVSVPLRSQPGDEKERFCRNCREQTLQTYQTSWNLFWTSHMWVCTRCGLIVDYIG